MMKKVKIILILGVLLLLVLGQVAYADVGPKPELDIEIVDLPDGEYYVALLILDAAGE